MNKRILITGMSGTGKSSVIKEMREHGYKAVDMDDSGWSIDSADGDWIWNEPRVQDLLDSLEDDEVLFLSGCADNQGQFYPQFDKIVLLSAPTDVIMNRLKTRTTNSYGKRPEELAETLGYIETVEPLLRKGADIEIDTSQSLEDVVNTLLNLLNEA